MSVEGILGSDRPTDAVARAESGAGGRAKAAIVAVAPAVILAGSVLHPFIGLGPPDDAAIARAVVSQSTLWGFAHLLIGLGSGLVALAFLAIRSHLRDEGDERWSPVGLAAIVLSSSLYALLPGMEFAALAAAKIGADVRSGQAAIQPWFVPAILMGGLTFAFGATRFARAISVIGIGTSRQTRFVAGALMVAGISRLFPLTGAQLYLHAVALVAALWPLSYVMAKRSTMRRRS
jgi:hypothetical protein